MKAAIYSRKSKFTEQGESVENQIQLCRDYALSRLDLKESDISVYVDEGFSGGTAERPRFQALLTDAKARRFGALICYRLDRVSRSIADFSMLMKLLENHGIRFISIREQFDTTTPMGRAMLYISSVFAQLERETITERIRDNMLLLARTGRWLGGPAPLGYRAVSERYADTDGKPRKQCRLELLPAEASLVRRLYEKYLELGSLSALEAYCLQNNLTGRGGNALKLSALRAILQNPVYCAADARALEFLSEQGCGVFAQPNASLAIMSYNKTSRSHGGTRRAAKSEWTISVGAHAPAVDSGLWIQAQALLKKNASRSYRTAKRGNALLSGVIRCARCGSLMRPKQTGRPYKDETRYYYVCELKERSRGAKCAAKNAPGNELDALIAGKLRALAAAGFPRSASIEGELPAAVERIAPLPDRRSSIERDIASYEREAQRLLRALGSAKQLNNAAAAIIRRLEAIEAARQSSAAELEALCAMPGALSRTSVNRRLTDALLREYSRITELASPDIIRPLIRAIIKCAEWDGEAISVYISERANM